VFFFPIFFAASSYKPSTVVQLFSVLYIEITQDHVYVPAYVYCVYTAVRPCTIRESSRFSSTSCVQTASRLLIIIVWCVACFFLFFFFIYYSVYSCVVSLCVLYVFYKKKEESFLTVN
jgi:hypothetical protein